MRRGRVTVLMCLLAGLTLTVAERAWGAEAIAVAVLDFDAIGAPALGPDGGAMVGELLAAALSTRDGIRLVERAALRRAMDEQALGLSGMVNGATAARVGRLVGSQVLVTGRVFAVSHRLVIAARIIGTETGHLEAVATEGHQDDLRALTSGMADGIVKLLAVRGDAFLPVRHAAPDPTTELAKRVAGMALPRVAVRVRETVLDIEAEHSAAASELTSLLLAANFQVRRVSEAVLPAEVDEYLAKPQAAAGVDVVVLGRAEGRFGLRSGDLVSAKGRVKLTAVDTRTRRVLAVSEMEANEIDLAPREAALQAITVAIREIARDFVPKLVLAWNRKASR